MLAAAFAACALAPTGAHADDLSDAINDGIAEVTDTATDLLAGCSPAVTNWTPLWETPTAFIRNNSTWYREKAGGIAHLSCKASVKMVVRVVDDSVPPFAIYQDRPTTTFVTNKDPAATDTNEVPYFGPDAPVLRPYGHITVHVEVFRKLSTGRYSKIRFGCMEFVYIFVAATGSVVTDNRESGACTYDAVLIADEAVEGAEATVGVPIPVGG